MTRVNENRETQKKQDEQRRLQQQDQARTRQSADKFNKVMNQKQTETRAAETQQSDKGQKTSKKGNAKSALMAKAGIQGRRFDGLLKNQSKGQTHKKENLDQAESTESRENQKVTEDGQSQTEEARAEQRHERLESVSRDDGRKGGGGDEGGGEGAGGDSMSGGQEQAGSGLGGDVSGGLDAQVAAGSAQQLASGAGIPAHVIQEIVKRILLGANEEGLSEFQIQFSDDVLGGTSLKITADGGKIKAQWQTKDANTRRLLRASEGELARAFAAKNLQLDSMEVEGPLS